MVERGLKLLLLPGMDGTGELFTDERMPKSLGGCSRHAVVGEQSPLNRF